MSDHFPSAKSRCLGRPSDFIRNIDSLPPGTQVVLFCRVSGIAQQYNGNLDNQRSALRSAAARRSLQVVFEFDHTGPGWDLWHGLATAAAIAKLRSCTAIIACSTSRLVRTRAFHSQQRPDAQPNGEDLRDMASAADGVTLVTLLPADASPAEERGFLSALGQRAKCNKGGRPKKKLPGAKKHRKAQWLDTARELRAEGLSLGQIAKQINVPKPTVASWLK